MIPIIQGLGISLLFNKEEELVKLFEKINLYGEGISIDVGANIGQTLSKLISAGYQDIICFEPDPRGCNYMYRLAEANKFLNTKNLSIVCAGLSSEKIEFLEIITSISKSVQSASADHNIRDYSSYDYKYKGLATN